MRCENRPATPRGSDAASFTPAPLAVPTDWNHSSLSALSEALEVSTRTITFPAALCEARTEATLTAWKDLQPVFQLVKRRRGWLLCRVVKGRTSPPGVTNRHYHRAPK